MEKVIAVQGYKKFSNVDLAEINELLAQGWTVKQFKFTGSDPIIAIFVLEK